jgi:hypothetical protein
MKPCWIRLFQCSVFILLLVDVGCGYRAASKNRLTNPYDSISVKPLLNETTTYEVEQILTRSIVSEFVQRSDLSVVNDPQRADLVLEGTISRVSVSPMTIGRSGFASTFQVMITVSVALKDRKSGETVFQENGLLFRDQYVINVDVEEFFSEQNPALGRIANDFASSVVTTMLEDF